MKSSPESMPAHRIYLVDDHPMMRDGMGRFINDEPGLFCCGQAGSAEQALSEIPQLKPDLVITDITLPGRNGLDLIRDLKAILPDLWILVFSMHDEMIYADRALRAGARGYLMKEAGSEKMLEAIHRILKGEMCVSARISAKILELFSEQSPRGSQSPVDLLTDREFDVYRLIGEGCSTKEIADKLHLSHKTVAVHRGHIKEKLKVRSGAELMRHAIEWSGSRPANDP
jgi:DNA-binding NarL/FixJ family response regulator